MPASGCPRSAGEMAQPKGGTFKQRCLEVIARPIVRASVISPLCPSDISPANGGNLVASVRLPSLAGEMAQPKGARSNADASR